jgi:hypothetical protein
MALFMSTICFSPQQSIKIASLSSSGSDLKEVLHVHHSKKDHLIPCPRNAFQTLNQDNSPLSCVESVEFCIDFHFEAAPHVTKRRAESRKSATKSAMI